MLSCVSVVVDVLALLVSVFFLLKELRLTRDSIRHSDFVNSINRSAENMLRITEKKNCSKPLKKSASTAAAHTAVVNNSGSSLMD